MEACKYYKKIKGFKLSKWHFSIKQRVLCQTNILPFVEFYGSHKKEKHSLKMYNFCSSYQIYYLFSSFICFNIFRCGF